MFSHVWVAISQNCEAPHSVWTSQPALQSFEAGSHHSNAPQPFVVQLSMHAGAAAPEGTKPALHCTPHAVPSHVRWPLGTVGQGVHELPQLAGAVLAAQLPAHSWKALAHALLQVPPAQDAVALARAGQTAHAAPQAVTSVSPLHVLPHAWKLASQDELHVPRSQVTVPFAGLAQSAAVRQPSLHVRVLALQNRP